MSANNPTNAELSAEDHAAEMAKEQAEIDEINRQDDYQFLKFEVDRDEKNRRERECEEQFNNDEEAPDE